MKLSTLLNLDRQYTFYKHFHTNTINRRIHYIFVPILLITAFTILSELPLPFPPPFTSAAPLVLSLYILHGIALDPLLGTLHSLFLLVYYRLSQTLYHAFPPPNTLPVALTLHIIAWLAQFIGHYLFEKRSPALMVSLVQALSSAPIIIWLELLFNLGFLPDVKARLARAPVAAKARKAVASASTPTQ